MTWQDDFDKDKSYTQEDTVPVEQRVANNLLALMSGLEMGKAAPEIASATYQGLKDLGEEGSIFPTSNFKNWFGASKVVDDEGAPKVLYHGTTHNFDTFNPSIANPENYLGKGIYLTDSPTDVNANYAGKGPDLTARIENKAEQIFQDMFPN